MAQAVVEEALRAVDSALLDHRAGAKKGPQRLCCGPFCKSWKARLLERDVVIHVVKPRGCA
ncbi:hypothetical protein, partial [Acidovorax sp. SD340]